MAKVPDLSTDNTDAGDENVPVGSIPGPRDYPHIDIKARLHGEA